jgi:Cu+-exporting ATPase
MEHARHDPNSHHGHEHVPPTTVKDPVCGMTVTPGSAKGGSHVHAGTTYWFCNSKCREKFAGEPARYLAANRSEPAHAHDAHAHAHAHAPQPQPPAGEASSATEYTCPMHPEIVRPGPGACPICGMALEPRTASADDTENAELTDMRRRFWISALLGLAPK